MVRPAADSPSNGQNPLGCLARVFWMLGGNLLVGVLAIQVASAKACRFSAADAGYWAAVGALLAVRWADIKWLNGTAADGESVTMTHWRRYALFGLAVGLAVWLAAHGFACWRAS